jgi:glucose-6-phosphate isomerase
MPNAPLTTRPAWQALRAHQATIRDLTLKELFAKDATRGTRLTLEGAGVYLDYSKNRVNDETLSLLLQLAEQSGLRAHIDAMFRGDRINVSENRSVLHVALRAPKGESIVVDGRNVVEDVHAVLDKMTAFANRIRSGDWKGHTGKRIRNVVNIGIGGSDLGPVMAYEALKFYSDRAMTFRFVSNVDGTDFAEAVRDLDAEETLFVVSSKTFTTLETMTNAHSARDWALAKLGGDAKAVAKHFVAVSTNDAKVSEFGIDTANMFGFWDWVGGRYSMDSAIGLSTMLAVGPDNFRAMLAGFHEMDEHFRTAPFERNLPCCSDCSPSGTTTSSARRRWRCCRTSSISSAFRRICSSSRWRATASTSRLPARTSITTRAPSTGASPARTGSTRSTSSSTRARGSSRATSSCSPSRSIRSGRITTCWRQRVRQAEALAFGKTPEQVKAEGTPDWLVPHRVFEGNRPSNVMMLDKLDPASLGRLVALYEHSVFTQGTVWDIDSFDQWGVELGKVLAQRIIPELSSSSALTHDSSTSALIQRYRQRR